MDSRRLSSRAIRGRPATGLLAVAIMGFSSMVACLRSERLAPLVEAVVDNS